DVACLVAGGAVGAVIRFFAVLWWPSPLQILFTTLIAALVAFVLVGIVLALRAGAKVRAFVAGTSGAVASLSAYIGIGINQQAWLAAAFLILTPAAVLTGLIAGASLGVLMTAGRQRASDTAT